MIEIIRQFVESEVGFSLEGVSNLVVVSLSLIILLLAIAAIISFFVQIYLAIKYVIYNRTKNSIGKSGKDIARQILDENGLNNIKVKTSGSLLFGNSYSHFFRKVRLRRLTWKIQSISSLAMASQKSCLAILDKENDPDMKVRNTLTPFIYFGPLFCLPLIAVGVILDLFILQNEGFISTFICTILGFSSYFISFVMAFKILKTEKKAQEKAYVVLKANNMATDEEIEMLKKLFKLYNIEYINNVVVSLLEIIYRILQLIAIIQKNKD